MASQVEEARYRLLVDAITDYAIYMLDPQGYVTSWNAGAQRFKGYRAEEIIGQHFSRFYTDEERAAGLPARALRTAVEEGRFEREAWRVRKDGERFWAHVVIDPIRTPDGELIGFAKITRDLTERKEAEAALRRNEEQFRLLVQGVTDYAIYMLDRDGRVTNWNVGAERIKGYRPDEIVGQHFSRFYTDEDRARGLPQQVLESARRMGRWEQEGWRVRKDGSRFFAYVVVDAIRDDSGEVIGFAKVTRDITERREAQRALEEAREALFQSQKMDAIGQLTGGVAHDFNNLLMVVLGSLELARKRLPDDARLVSLIDNAIQGAQRGMSLTQRMLAFARKQELKLEAVNVAGLVRGMLGMLQRSIGPSVHVEMSFPADLPQAHTDPNQLETALLNLAVNARDAMPGGGTISIAARAMTVGAGDPSLVAGDYICLGVRDTGEGMDEATLARALEPFFTTKDVGKGTGLGLSMVHGLAAQSGGRLVLRSRPGEGTMVELCLPVAAPAAGNGVTVVEQAADTAAGTPQLTILAVDDDGLVLMNTVALLEDLGHRVLQASSGAEALELLGGHPEVDLVMTDQAMPRMSGLQLCDAVREMRPDLPLLLATGFADPLPGNDRAFSVLLKPFTQDELSRAVQSAVGLPEA